VAAGCQRLVCCECHAVPAGLQGVGGRVGECRAEGGLCDRIALSRGDTVEGLGVGLAVGYSWAEDGGGDCVCQAVGVTIPGGRLGQGVREGSTCVCSSSGSSRSTESVGCVKVE
jgi:hypothetical protein